MLGSYIDRFTGLPVLFTDVCGVGILLDGEVLSDGISYRDAFYPVHPSDLLSLSGRNSAADCQRCDELYALLARGTHIRLDGSQVIVSRGERVLETMRRPPHLDWQLVAFESCRAASGFAVG